MWDLSKPRFDYEHPFDNDTAPGSVTWGDYARALGSGAAGLGSTVAAGGRALAEANGSDYAADLFDYWQSSLSDVSQDLQAGMTDEARRRLEAKVNSGEFWDHPFSAGMLKTVNMSPALVATIVPAGMFAGAVGATVAAAGAGAALSAAQVVDDTYKQTDAMSDEQLQQMVPYYKAQRELGVDERTARVELNQKLNGVKPLIAAAVGAAATAIGPAGSIARAGKATAAEVPGLLSRVGTGAVEGAGGMAAQEGITNAAAQDTRMQLGTQPGFSGDEFLDSIIDGSFFGGALGAAGGVLKPKGPAAAKPPKVENVPATGPSAEQAAALTPGAQAQKLTGEIDAAAQAKPTPPPNDAPVPSPAGQAAQAVTAEIDAAAQPPAGPPAPPRVPEAPSAAPVTQPGNAPEKAVTTDVDQNTVPESNATLAAQRDELISGQRPAVFYPTRAKGQKSTRPPLPPGMVSMGVKGGTIHFNPKLIKAKDIVNAMQAGRLNEILGLGSQSKADVMARVQQGETPTAVTLRDSTGTPVRDSAATVETAPQTAAEMAATAKPGDTIEQRSPADVIAERQQATAADQARELAGEMDAAEAKRQEIDNAAKETVQPTPEQAESGEYHKPAMEIASGVPFRMETPKGGVRRAPDGSWEVKDFPAHYGEDTAVKGADGDGLDYFVGDHPDAKEVYVIDQIDPETGKFDEHKVMTHFASKEDALRAYDKAFSDGSGKARVGAVMTWDLARFHDWRKKGDTTKPVLFDDKSPNQRTGVPRNFEDKAARERHVDQMYAEHMERGEEPNLTREEFGKRAESGRNFAKKLVDSEVPPERLGEEPVTTALQSKKLDPKVWTPEVRRAVAKANREPVEPEAKQPFEKKGKKFQAERAQEAETAKRVFDEHVPKEQQEPPTDRAGKIALLRRLDAMVKAAAEGGVKFRKKPGYASTADHTVYLHDARDLANKLRLGKASDTHIREFIADENLARGGDFAALRERRKVQGDEKMRRGQPETEGESPRAELAQPHDEGQVHSLNPEEAVSKMQEGAIERESVHQEPTAEEEAARHAALEKKGAGGVEAPVTSAGKGKIKVEVRSGGRLKHRARLKEIEGEGDAASAVDKPITLSLAELTDHLNWDTVPLGPQTRKFHTDVGKVLVKRLKSMVGNVPVKIISRAEMKRLTDEIGYKEAEGMYDPRTDTIYLSDEFAIVDGKINARLFMHEAVHAALSRAIEIDEHFGRTVERLRRHVAQYALGKHYGLKDAHEFISEALSNPSFQAELASIKAPDWAVRELGMGQKKPVTLWQWFVGAARKYALGIANRLGLSPDGHSALEAVMHIGERLEHTAQNLEEIRREQGLPPRGTTESRPRLSEAAREDLPNRVKERAGDTLINTRGGLRRLGQKLKTFGQVAQEAVKAYGGSDAPRKVAQLRELMRVARADIMDKGGAHDWVRDGAALERKYEGSGQFEKAAELAYDATINDVNLGPGANNEHLGKDKTAGWQGKARLPELQARYDALPADLQDWIQRGAAHFRDVQNEMSLTHIQNILKAHGVDEGDIAEMADKIHDQGVTPDILETLNPETKTLVENLNKARELKKINGMYFPLHRHGDFVVNGRYELPVPKNGIKIADDEVQFLNPDNQAATRRMAEEYVRGHELTHVGTRRVWVDRNDPTRTVDAEDPNAVRAYRVKMQTQHTEFHETEAEAHRAAQNLREKGLTVEGVGFKRLSHAQNADLMGSQLRTVFDSLQKREGYLNMTPAQQKELTQAMREASLRLMAGTRVQASRLPRRKVAGYSKDLLRNAALHSEVSAGYLARLRHMPDIEDALKEMRDYNDANKHDAGRLHRDELYNEIESRVYGDPEAQQPGGFNRLVRRALQISSLDKLAGVSFHVVNGMEPWTTSMPVIGGRHGFFKAQRALARAYSLIGAGDGVIKSIRDTMKAFRQDSGFTDYRVEFKKLIDERKELSADQKARYKQVLDHLHETGLMDNDSGIEVARAGQPSMSLLGRGLDRAELMARQVGQAVESINRAVTGLSAYELEFKKTGDHEAALRYAHDVTHDTMGNYSRTNAPPAFNSTFGRVALQFKKFGQKTYYLLGKMMAGVLRGDKEAAKQFAGIMFTHATVAGLLGLPIEPIRVGLIASNALGVTNFTPDDFDNLVRQTMAGLLGKTGGEVASRGVTRLVGVDTSSRFGLDSLLTFGQPKSQRANDLKNWLFDTMAGAPAGYALDQVRASQALFKGKYDQAAELALPIKGITDVIKAGRGMAGAGAPFVDENGRKGMAPLNLGEAAAQAIGFTPARKSEQYEFRAAASGDTRQQTEERRDWMSQWVQATPSERAKLWGKIEKWNQSRPREARLTRAQLDKQAHSRQKEHRVGGVAMTKQSRYLVQKNDIYNR